VPQPTTFPEFFDVAISNAVVIWKKMSTVDVQDEDEKTERKRP
jgi:hypothetical protein